MTWEANIFFLIKIIFLPHHTILKNRTYLCFYNALRKGSYTTNLFLNIVHTFGIRIFPSSSIFQFPIFVFLSSILLNQSMTFFMREEEKKQLHTTVEKMSCAPYQWNVPWQNWPFFVACFTIMKPFYTNSTHPIFSE